MKLPVLPLLLSILPLAAAPKAGLPPSTNFDLSRWYLGLPVNAEGSFSGKPLSIKTADLCKDYSHPSYFYTGEGGSMVFEVPWNGANTSGAPRTELRETRQDGSLFNWTTPSEGGTHILEGVCSVDRLGKGKVAIGQIHGKEPNIPTVILRYDNTKEAPFLYVTVKKHPNDPKTQDRHEFPGVPLGVRISYRLVMTDDPSGPRFSITVNGKTASFVMHPDWRNVTQYFKAGAYYTVPEKNITAKVSFQELKIRHGTDK